MICPSKGKKFTKPWKEEDDSLIYGLTTSQMSQKIYADKETSTSILQVRSASLRGGYAAFVVIWKRGV